MMQTEVVARSLGGPGSGNFGHSGRPGEVGGSGVSATITDASTLTLYRAGDISNASGGYEAIGSGAYFGLSYESVSGYAYGDRKVKTFKASGNLLRVKGDVELQKYRDEAAVEAKTRLSKVDWSKPTPEDMKWIAPSSALSAYLSSKGYVGIHYEHTTTDDHHTQVVIFNPRTISGIRGGSLSFRTASRTTAALLLLARRNVRMLGGPGSGNFGHAGRPGEVGGSSQSFSSVDEADKWGVATQSWDQGLTDRQAVALHAYTTVVGLNETLREGNEAVDHQVWGRDIDLTERELLAELDGVFASPAAVLPESVIVHRSWNGPSAPKGAQVGDEFIDHGFTSTALVMKEIANFKERGGVDVTIHVPKGTRALYLGSQPKGRGWFAANTELVINRGTRYRVLKVERRRSGKQYVTLEALYGKS